MSGGVIDYPVVVGLGNPGERYNGTRHNIGFSVVDLLVACRGVNTSDQLCDRAKGAASEALAGRLDHTGWNDQKSYLTANLDVCGVRGLIIKPRTFMNRSGEPLQGVLAFKKIPLGDVIVVHDEIDIPVGALRVKTGGGEGGHNGLRSIASSCGGKDFGRIRCGVGKPPQNSSAYLGEDGIARWVLSRYAKDEVSIVENLLVRAVEAVISLISRGVAETQNRFNR